MSKKFYYRLGWVIGILAIAIAPSCFPYNIPLALLGGALVGWNKS